MRNAYVLLVGKSNGRRPQERPRLRWMDNIKKDLGGRVCDGVDLIGLAQDRDKLGEMMGMR
jgi:hypothetical protein